MLGPFYFLQMPEDSEISQVELSHQMMETYLI
jgi:hypothetical protein